MNFGFRAEVGYNPAKDVTFLKTNTPDFTEQLTIPVARDSKEDREIRTLLEDQGIVDFVELNRAVRLPDLFHMTFGLVGSEEDNTLTPAYYDHLVLFGKEGSGAINLIRFWLLWAARQNIHIVSIDNPSLYGMEQYLNSNLVHHLDPEELLEEQFRNSGVFDGYNSRVLLLVGADYTPERNEDSEFIEKIQNGEYHEDDNIFSFIHRSLMSDSTFGDTFFGSEGDPTNVSYAVIGDVNERTAKLVGPDVPTRNPRGVAWFKQNGTQESKRVRTFMIPRSYSLELYGQVVAPAHL
jgi:hypothetical protein